MCVRVGDGIGGIAFVIRRMPAFATDSRFCVSFLLPPPSPQLLVGLRHFLRGGRIMLLLPLTLPSCRATLAFPSTNPPPFDAHPVSCRNANRTRAFVRRIWRCRGASVTRWGWLTRRWKSATAWVSRSVIWKVLWRCWRCCHGNTQGGMFAAGEAP